MLLQHLFLTQTQTGQSSGSNKSTENGPPNLATLSQGNQNEFNSALKNSINLNNNNQSKQHDKGTTSSKLLNSGLIKEQNPSQITGSMTFTQATLDNSNNTGNSLPQDHSDKSVKLDSLAAAVGLELQQSGGEGLGSSGNSLPENLALKLPSQSDSYISSSINNSNNKPLSDNLVTVQTNTNGLNTESSQVVSDESSITILDNELLSKGDLGNPDTNNPQDKILSPEALANISDNVQPDRQNDSPGVSTNTKSDKIPFVQPTNNQPAMADITLTSDIKQQHSINLEQTSSSQDKTPLDKTLIDKAGLDKAGLDKVGLDKVGLDKAGLDKAGLDKAGLDKVGLDKAGLDKAGLDKAGLDKAGLDKAGLDKAGLDKAPIVETSSLINKQFNAELVPSLKGDKNIESSRPSILSSNATVQVTEKTQSDALVQDKQKFTKASESDVKQLNQMGEISAKFADKPASLRMKDTEVKQSKEAQSKITGTESNLLKTDTPISKEALVRLEKTIKLPDLIPSNNVPASGLTNNPVNASLAMNHTHVSASLAPMGQATSEGLLNTPTNPSLLAKDAALSVNVPKPQWNQRFAERISMLTLKGASHARIRLDPPELGPLSVRIHTQGGETSIQFTVNNPIARDLIDSGAQRLREMLEEHGFNSVDVGVNEYKHQGGETGEQSDLDEADIDFLSRQETELQPKARPIASYQDSIGIVDIFA